ncbi:MAG TPA: hypothetical protein VFL76_04830 [Edaphocola sp.]|nr:hypothetical protein [Edaphocola sp.]
MIQDPFLDTYVDVDEHTFLGSAFDLKKYHYSGIWITVFSDFKNSGFPLFAAINGTIYKTIDLSPYWGVLFLKLNVAFVGCFVPGVVYLLCCRLSENYGKSFTASIAYGTLSVVLFYSVGLMRDIHIALIYAIGIYIITGNGVSIKKYIILMILGVAAYFIRIENGLFFLAFIAAWSIQSGGKYKIAMIFFAILCLAYLIYWIGGISTIIDTATATADIYQGRAGVYANTGSLGMKLNKLPIPFNYLAKSAFGQIDPFPFWARMVKQQTVVRKLFFVPEAVAGLFWFYVWLRLLFNFRRTIAFFARYKYAFGLALLYIIMVSVGQANPRRLMAVYPMIYLCFFYIDNRVFRLKEILYAIGLYVLLLAVYFVIK